MDREKINIKFNKAILLLGSENYTEAEVLYKEILDEMPENETILHHLFMTYFGKEDFDKAEEYIKKAIKHSKNKHYYKDLADTYYKQDKFSMAIDTYIKTLKYFPKDVSILYPLAVAYLADYKADRKKQLYKQISYSPDYKLDKAKFYFNKVLNLEPEHEHALFNMAFVYSQRLDLKKTVEYYNKIINIKKNFGEAAFLLGQILLKSGNYLEGWKLYEARLYIRTGIDL